MIWLAIVALLLLGGGVAVAEEVSTPAPSPPDTSGDWSFPVQDDSTTDPLPFDFSQFAAVDPFSGADVITNDPATWPTGNRIWDICRAIAMAEGANVPGSNPDRLNNPGDISDGAKTFGYEEHSGSKVTKFPDKQTGWNWLYDKIQNIASGSSSSYDPDWSWTQIAKKYAGNWSNWVNNVTRQLGVSPDSTLAEYVNS